MASQFGISLWHFHLADFIRRSIWQVHSAGFRKEKGNQSKEKESKIMYIL
jgi:hypothetical protein